MKILSMVLLTLIASHASCDAAAHEIAIKIEVRLSKSGVKWVNVQEVPGKYREFYESSRDRFIEYIAKNHPERLEEIQNHAKDVKKKAFLVFHNPSKNIYRSGWYLEWSKSFGCTTPKWEYEYYGCTSDGAEPGLGESASGMVSESGLCHIE